MGELEELLVGIETLLLKITGLCRVSVGVKQVSGAAVVLGGTGPRQGGGSWWAQMLGLLGKQGLQFPYSSLL